MFKPHHKGRMVDDACQTVESSFEGFTPISTPRLIEGDFSHEEEALRYVESYAKKLQKLFDFVWFYC